jgi:hypothetical protein
VCELQFIFKDHDSFNEIVANLQTKITAVVLLKLPLSFYRKTQTIFVVMNKNNDRTLPHRRDIQERQQGK